MNRGLLIKLHVVLAAVMLPAIVLFLVTGSLYTWGIKGEYHTQTVELALARPLQKDQVVLTQVATQALAAHQVELPSGKPSLKKMGEAYQLEWTGADRDVLLEPTADPLKATLTIKDTSWYRHIVQLHKAKGGVVFKVYAAAAALSLLLLLISGVTLALQMPKLRAITLGSLGGGVLLCALAIVLS